MTMLKIPQDQIKLRPFNNDDYNFILSTWLKSYRNSPFAKHIPNDIYFKVHEALIENTLMTNKVIVLCDPEVESQILGYIVRSLDDKIVHYIYVKYQFRKLGLGHYLLAHGGEPEIVTHLPRRYNDNRKYIYNPYLMGT